MSRTPGPNERCPCGSGRKYKKCHGSGAEAPDSVVVPLPIPPERVLDAFIDEQRKHVIFVSNDILLQSLKRDCPAIAADFDEQFKAELQLFNDEFGRTMNVVIRVIPLDDAIQPPELRKALVFLVWNAAQSFLAALDLLRRGFRLQPATLLRTVVEQLATVVHLVQKPADLEGFRNGALKSSKAVTTASKGIPQFGFVWGLFSNHFTHIHHVHFLLNPLEKYTLQDEALSANLSFLRTGLWFLSVVTELAFYRHVREPRYWQPIGGGGYKWNPSPEVQRQMDTFLTEDFVGHRAAESEAAVSSDADSNERQT